MGGGCFKANGAADPGDVLTTAATTGNGCELGAVKSPTSTGNFEDSCGLAVETVEEDELLRRARARAPELEAALAPLLKAASKGRGASNNEVLRALAAAGEPAESGAWLRAWCHEAEPKKRAAMLALLLRAIDDTVAPKVAAAERAVADLQRDGSEAGAEMVAQLGQLTLVCGESLRLGPEQRDGVAAAAACLEGAARSPVRGLEAQPGAFLVPAFDRIVMVFRFALLRHVSDTVNTLRRWREFETEVGLPRLDAHLALLGGASKAALLGMRWVPEESQATTLVVRRGAALQDAAAQLPEGAPAVLSPYFLSESGTKRVQGKLVEGGEGHGLRKEFFILVSADALGKKPMPLFEFHRGSGQHWFSGLGADLAGQPLAAGGATAAASADAGVNLAERYSAFGKLIALAITNHCKLSFSLPLIFFRLLLRPSFVPELADLASFDESLMASMRKCLTMKDAQFHELLKAEGLSAHTSRKEYVDTQVAEVLAPRAMAEVRKGFWNLVDKAPDEIQGVSAADLRQMVCPSEAAKGTNQDFRKVFQVVMEEEMATNPVFTKAFWSVVDSFSPEEKRLFLLFFTGLETWPEPGTERLAISLPFSAFSSDEHDAMLNMLPQAHTCANTLELPNYYMALKETRQCSDSALEPALRNIIGEKLRIAIRECGGYDLDATEAPSISRPASGVPPPWAWPRVTSSPMPAAAVLASTVPAADLVDIPLSSNVVPASLPFHLPGVPLEEGGPSVVQALHAMHALPSPDIDSFISKIEKLTQEKFVMPAVDRKSDVDSILAELELE